MNDQISDLNRDLPKAYDPQSVEQRLYDGWEASGLLQARDPVRPGPGPPRREGLRDLHAAAQRDRRAAPGPRHHRHHGRPDDPLAPHAGEPTLWVPGSRPRQHRRALRDRQGAEVPRALHGRRCCARSASRCRRTSAPDPPRPGPRDLPEAGLGLARPLRPHHHRAAPPPGRHLRLGARALHPGPRPLPRRAHHLRAASTTRG